MLRISISGAQCSGKSTLLEGLKKDIYFRDFEFIPSFSSEIAKSYKHSENTTLETQLLMFYYSSINAFRVSKKNEIHDRSYLDVLVYSSFLKDVNTDVFVELSRSMINKFTHYFILDSDGIELEENGIRSVDLDFRNRVNTKFLKLEDIPNVYILKSDLNRVQYIKDILSNSKVSAYA